MNYLLVYLSIINAISFVLMLVDKIKAKHQRWRIPEKVLLGVSFIGGSLGGVIGMHLFRHKTKHLRFAIGIPLMLLLHVGLLIYFKVDLF